MKQRWKASREAQWKVMKRTGWKDYHGTPAAIVSHALNIEGFNCGERAYSGKRGLYCATARSRSGI